MTESDLIIQEAHYGGDQMPWAEFVIAGNTVFLSGAEGRDMSRKQEYPGGEPPSRRSTRGWKRRRAGASRRFSSA